MFSSRKSAAPSTGYLLTKSLRFRSSASAYLDRTPASAGNRQIWTWSGWVKLGLLSPASGWNCIFGAYSDDNNRTFFYTNNNSVSNTFYIFDVSGGSTTCNLISTQVLRDVSAWYHLVVSVDTTQSTSSNRIKVYLNGTQITAFGTASYPSQNANLMVNNNVVHYIGASRYSGINLFHDGYLAEVNFVDGQALTPSSFGQTSSTTGVWQPIKYTGTYGTNGFYLPFTNTTSTTTLGNDFSGNGNNWTTNNISLTSGSTYDSMTDVPTNTDTNTANYAVLNPLNPSGGTYSDGNLKWVSATTDGRFALSTFDITSSGKWYCEVTIGTKSGTYWTVGAFGSPITFNPRMQYRSDGATQVDSSAGSTWASYTTGDVIGMAFDASTNQITFYKNNTSQGTLTASTTGVSYYFGCGSDSSGSTSTYTINFGQQPFTYTPPTGFKALNTFNLPTPTIGATASTQASKYMNIVLYTGDNSSSPRSITGFGFSPDFVWVKARSNTIDHNLWNSVMGAGSSQGLHSNTTAAAGDSGNFATYGYVSSLDSDGFTVTKGSDATYGNFWHNYTSTTYVAWAWDANGSGSSNTAGSITSTVSANTTAGFSIVTYTGNGTIGATIGHGLGVAPSMLIVKQRTGGLESWQVYHSALGATQYLQLNSNLAAGTNINRWNNTAPTSTVFTVYNDTINNGNTNTYVAYCFAAVAGYSAFGSFTGNGSTDGPFLYLGFRPRYILIKRTNDVSDWWVWDTARNTINVMDSILYPNDSAAEYVSSSIFGVDALSNGFKMRTNNSVVNGSSQSYIYMAFAENPFKYSLAR